MKEYIDKEVKEKGKKDSFERIGFLDSDINAYLEQLKTSLKRSKFEEQLIKISRCSKKGLDSIEKRV